MLSFLSWNINGLIEKQTDYMLLDIVNKYDCIILTETWNRDNFCLQKYVSFNVVNSFLNRKGRPSGGITVSIRYTFCSGIFLIEKCDLFICLKLDKIAFNMEKDIILYAVYLPPDNATYYKRTESQSCERLKQSIINLKHKGEILLMGDFNARTATLADFITHEKIDHNEQSLNPLKFTMHNYGIVITVMFTKINLELSY